MAVQDNQNLVDVARLAEFYGHLQQVFGASVLYVGDDGYVHQTIVVNTPDETSESEAEDEVGGS